MAPDRVIYVRLDVGKLTPGNAPSYLYLTFEQRNTDLVLASGAPSGLMLVGQLGVNYYPDGPGDRDGIYLRRHDRPALRAARDRRDRTG